MPTHRILTAFIVLAATSVAVHADHGARRKLQRRTSASTSARSSRGGLARLAPLTLTRADLNHFVQNKVKLWDAKVHESSTRHIPTASGDYFRGMRLTPADIQRFAHQGMGDATNPQRPRIDATNMPRDAWVFALTGGHNPRGGQPAGPQGDYLAVMFRISEVGKSLPFSWNTHGPGYGSDRLRISKTIPAQLITGMWVYDKKSETFVDHTSTWRSLAGQ